MERLIIQNILYKGHPGATHVWISFTPETSRDIRDLRDEIRRLIQAIREHAKMHWSYKSQDLEAIREAKIDIAQDFRGSFLPLDEEEAKYEMQTILQCEMFRIFNDLDKNFLSHGMTGDLTVKKGKNDHRSCF